MSNFSKIVILIIIVLSFFFIKEKTGLDFDNVLNSVKLPKLELPKQEENNEPIKKPVEILEHEKETMQQTYIYFLALDSNSNGIYKKVKREMPKSINKFNYSIEELLKGPNTLEKAAGAYTEIPQSTKLLDIKENGNKIIINLSSDFQNGGGTDSIYSRMMQLIKTSLENAGDRKVFLYIDGKQINFIGGEGIMISQPLTEKSLDI